MNSPNVAPLEANIDLQILGADAGFGHFQVTIDTGFDGFLGLTSETINNLTRLSMPPLTSTFADGSTQLTPRYAVMVMWNNRPMATEALEIGYDIIGMRMFRGNRLIIDVTNHGVLVDIRPLSSTPQNHG